MNRKHTFKEKGKKKKKNNFYFKLVDQIYKNFNV